MSAGQHASMQDSRNQNATAPLPVEYDVLTMLMTSQAGANVITGPADCRILRKNLAASLKVAKVTNGLVRAPLM
jgi:hypothetical protein